MPELLRLFVDRLESPIGELTVVVDARGRARAITWTADETRMMKRLTRDYGELSLEAARNPGGVTESLRAYFGGTLDAIERVPVEAAGTPFSRAIWAALREIRCGTTASYADIARRVGRPHAFRAVGRANNANPIAIVVPCHRVIGSEGSLVGYGGGLDSKRWLLAHEASGCRSAPSTGRAATSRRRSPAGATRGT